MTARNRPPKNKLSETMSEEVVRQMLLAAKLKEPWAYPVGIAGLVTMLQEASAGQATSEQIAADTVELRKLNTRAQRAVNELRAVLPLILRDLLPTPVGQMPSIFSIAINGEEQAIRIARHRFREVLALSMNLTDFPDLRALELFADWHFWGVAIWTCTRSVVGRGSYSKNGPLVSFVQQALRKTGHGDHSLAAIESALVRRLGPQKSPLPIAGGK